MERVESGDSGGAMPMLSVVVFFVQRLSQAVKSRGSSKFRFLENYFKRMVSASSHGMRSPVVAVADDCLVHPSHACERSPQISWRG